LHSHGDPMFVSIIRPSYIFRGDAPLAHAVVFVNSYNGFVIGREWDGICSIRVGQR
jgi:hypothetical protein